MGAVRDDDWLRGFGLVAVLIALAMRMFVPSGFMWAPAAGGGAQLIVCPGTTAQTAPSAVALMHHMAMPSGSGHDQPHQNTGPGDHECAFTALGGAIDLAISSGDALPPPPLRQAIRLVAALRDLGPGRGLAAPPPPQRGPPATF